MFNWKGLGISDKQQLFGQIVSSAERHPKGRIRLIKQPTKAQKEASKNSELNVSDSSMLSDV